jgi:hypothetical protein
MRIFSDGIREVRISNMKNAKKEMTKNLRERCCCALPGAILTSTALEGKKGKMVSGTLAYPVPQTSIDLHHADFVSEHDVAAVYAYACPLGRER